MRVVLFTRRPRTNQNFSIELIVEQLVRRLSPELDVALSVCRFQSNGVFRRIYNTIEAAFRRGDINHVSGDVHYLVYLLPPSKTILTIHDCGVISGPSSLRKRIIKLLWFSLPARRCAAITVVSETVKQDLLTRVAVAPEKVRVIPSMVPELYQSAPREIQVDCPRILTVGTAPNKNLHRLAEALAGIRCKLCIVGELSPAQVEVLEMNRVDYENFVGIPTEALRELYEGSDIVAFPSTFEGFGMPIIEAQLVGRPVVTSNVASMPEVAGLGACLVDPFDVAAIRAGLLRILEDADYRDSLIRHGHENAKRFAPSLVVRQYRLLYKEVACKHATDVARTASPSDVHFSTALRSGSRENQTPVGRE